MPQHNHGHPGPKEPRGHGKTHHENRVVDLNDSMLLGASFSRLFIILLIDRAYRAQPRAGRSRSWRTAA
jgi:hypothetical protein